MTRSVEELRRESERSRAELAATVDQLRERISNTAEDIRHKVSPQHIKSEVSDYVSHKTQSWVEAIKQRAMENPMQAIAASTAVAVPVLRLARGSSLPLLMIGAGLALTSKTVRDHAAEATAPAMDRAKDMLDDAAERAQALRDDMKDGFRRLKARPPGWLMMCKIRLPVSLTTSGAGRRRPPARSAINSGAAWMPPRTRQPRPRTLRRQRLQAPAGSSAKMPR